MINNSFNWRTNISVGHAYRCIMTSINVKPPFLHVVWTRGICPVTFHVLAIIDNFGYMMGDQGDAVLSNQLCQLWQYRSQTAFLISKQFRSCFHQDGKLFGFDHEQKQILHRARGVSGFQKFPNLGWMEPFDKGSWLSLFSTLRNNLDKTSLWWKSSQDPG